MTWRFLLVFIPVLVGAGQVNEPPERRVDLGVDVVLENLWGAPVRDVVLDVRLVPELTGHQRLQGVSLVNADNKLVTEDEDYTRLHLGDFLSGERRVVTLTYHVVLYGDVAMKGSFSGGRVAYEGYRSRVGTRSNLAGDCTEIAVQEIERLRSEGRSAKLVAGVVLSRDKAGQRLVTLHDWVASDGGGKASGRLWHDPAAAVLPGADHEYVALGVLDETAQRFPLYRVNKKGIKASLSFRHAH